MRDHVTQMPGTDALVDMLARLGVRVRVVLKPLRRRLEVAPIFMLRRAAQGLLFQGPGNFRPAEAICSP